MQKIEFEKIGIIKNSNQLNEIGWYITVQDDAKGSGGYKIYTSNNSNFEMDFKDPTKTTFNNWLEKKDHIPQFFKEAGLQVEWTSDGIAVEWADDMKSWRWKRT